MYIILLLLLLLIIIIIIQHLYIDYNITNTYYISNYIIKCAICFCVYIQE